MSKRRLVEYFMVTGVSKNQQAVPPEKVETAGAEYITAPLSPLSPLSEHVSRVDDNLFGPTLPPDVKVNAEILQRFPDSNRAESALPAGIEIFCQPMGWYLTFSPKPPAFVDFILTAEDGSRLYCSALNFYQLSKEKYSGSISRTNKKKRHSMPYTPTPKHTHDRKLSAEASIPSRKLPKLDFLDEGHEESWLVKDAYGDMYQPISLCLISKLPLFELLQILLKSLYISWLSGEPNQPLKLEPLVAELLADLFIPQVNCLPVKRPFGALKELLLPVIHEEMGAPYSSTSAWWLLRRVGVHQLLQLVSAVLCDTSILIVSSSYTVLTTALRALVAIVHPFNVSHSLVPVLPLELLEYTQLPSTYIMGVHTLVQEQMDEELLDVVEVYLDQGRVSIPDTITLPFFPDSIISYVQDALADILEPNFDKRDHAFHTRASSYNEEWQGKGSKEEFLDKKVRAVFLSLMTILLGDYQKFVTVLHFTPTPGFYFNMDAYLASREAVADHQSIFNKMAMSIAFYTFCYEHSVPFRHCDFYDEVVARKASNPRDFRPEKLFSRENIVEMAEELLALMPSCSPPGGPEFNMEGVHPELLDNPVESFPRLSWEVIKEKMKQYEEEQKKEELDDGVMEAVAFKRMIPILESTPSHRHKSVEYSRGVESLLNCLDAMFQSKIIEARKYVPSVIQSLKSGILSDMLMPALVDRFWQYGVLLSSEQFDLVVKLLNSALVDEHSAMTLLPLMTVIYREVHLGVQQYACTCVQNHSIWGKLDFWRDAIYLAIQAELVRIYAEVEADYKRKEMVKRREKKEEHEPSPEPPVEGDITLRSRNRIRSSSPNQTRANVRASRLALTRSAKVRMRMSVVVPGLSEGMLPPNAEPVTSQEAFHHLAKILDIWDKLPQEKQETLVRMEDNATTNQVILFVQRIINLRTPVELPDGEEERAEFLSDLEQFIARLLHMIEVDVAMDLTKQGKIIDQVHDMIQIHLESMSGLRKELRRLPVSKPKVVKPPLVLGEEFLTEQGTHAYLIHDGRDNGCMLPADGQVFLTTYRIIFLGTPCDPQAPSLIVTRSVPIGSVYRLKKLGPVVLPHPVSITTTGGLQLRSVTAELMKIGFDDETSQSDINGLEQQLIQLRNPASITLGIKSLSAADVVSPEELNLVTLASLPKKASYKREQKNKNPPSLGIPADLTRVKILSNISQSPYCREYERLKLGRVQFQVSEKGQWRTSTLNLSYLACSSYPSIVVVPSKVTDESLASLANQFQLNRFPVITWKHPRKEAVLLRSSSFVPSVIGKKKFSAHNILGQQALKQAASNKQTQNRAGVGVYNADFENYLYNMVQSAPATRPSLDQVQHISVVPPTMEFDEEELRRQNSFRSPASPSPTNESAEPEQQQDLSKGLGPRARAQTYGFKIRTRVGSSVSQLSRVVLTDKGSPSAGRRLSTKRKVFSSPQLPKRTIQEDAISRNSTCSTASDLSMDKTKCRDSLKEEPEMEDEMEKMDASEETPIPRSANASPTDASAGKKPSSHKRTRSSDQVIELVASDIQLQDIKLAEKSGSPEPPLSPIDWEAMGQAEKEELSPRLGSTPTPDNSERNSSPELLDSIGRGRKFTIRDRLTSKKSGKQDQPSPGSFSTLPTNPRDWIVMDMLPGELGHWQSSAMYILGDRAVLQDIPEDLYPSCTFVPVETPSPQDVGNSFKKLMRACIPSAHQAAFFSAVQDSGWGTQLAQLMQLGGAVADLIDIQGSSVLVCMENGWDATAQVVSIAQILLDPYYRTIEGFSMLIEKDWLAFGHRFSHNGSHTSATPMTTFTPIFLQFLDVVHQILKQFPLSFEFNDFYLRTLAYHHCSMRFHTFTADSEKERYANNWLGYRPRMANLHGNSARTEPHSSIWDYINTLHKDSMLFYNFRYNLKDCYFDMPPLRPHSYQANIDIWSFYLDNHLSQFPPYDTELLSEGPLTLLDMHHNFFEKEKLALMGVGGDHPGSTFSEITSLLWQYTKMMNAYAERSLNLPQVTWMELLHELVASSTDTSISGPLFPADVSVVSHSQTLHKRTTLAVLIKGKLAAELESHFTNPHQFEQIERGRKQYECYFCKNKISRNLDERVVKCKKCGYACHTHCSLLMPHNCGQEKMLGRRFSKKRQSPRGAVEGSNWTRQAGSVFFNTPDMLDGTPQVSEGYLYKKGKIVRNWKLRWFVMDTEKGEISYYDTNSNNHLHGTINLKDVTSVAEAEPQTVPTIKAETGFFFNVVTQKRVYSLMALRAAERAGWMSLIGAATNAYKSRAES